MKILTIVGARPQFIKAAAVSRIIRETFNEVLVHTGQHYDNNMSEIFFEELNIPRPDYNLSVGSGNHGKQTGEMLSKIEEIILQEKPECVLVYGDTNSTLAGALAASKLHIPVAHVEAGLRSFNMRMPEEQNRILTDHISTLLFAPTNTAIYNLNSENIKKNVYNTGDVMYDAVKYYLKYSKEGNDALDNLIHEKYVLSTIHRAENTNDSNRLKSIFKGLNESGLKVILPLHPRTKKYIRDYGIELSKNIKIIEPVGYLDMLQLQKNSIKIVTDSGGIQKEAYFMDKPCITMRDETEWVETIDDGWNILVGAHSEKITKAILEFEAPQNKTNAFGDGHAAEKICNLLDKLLK